METKDINLESLILPCDVFTHFDIVDVVDGPKEIDLFLDEKFVPAATSDYHSWGNSLTLMIMYHSSTIWESTSRWTRPA